MLLSRSQRIILGAAVGVALLLLVGLIAFACAKPRTAENAPSPSPSASATATPSPSPTPTPSARPTETPVYRLPLVPFAEETDAPTASPLAPVTAKPIDPSAMIEGRFDSNVRDFLTVGTEDGEPVAVLLVRLAPPNLWVLSVPCETLPTEPQTDAVTPAPSPKNEKNAAARRVSRAVASELGLKLDHTLTLDLTCAEELIRAVPTLSGGGMTFDEQTVSELMNADGAKRAYGMGALGVGIANLFSTVSPWKLPSLREATRGRVSTELNLWELFGLAAAFRGMRTTSVAVLPTVAVESGLAFAPSANAMLQRTFS
ncbi:MAG: hypothetical protein IJK01_07845 [Clostridia bacterium]|jgi:hypothetical protein|nr:hypothetical protein [Clostridia bacterium]